MLKLSEAASLALHTTVLMAGDPRKQLSAKEMAAELIVSEAHLAKVLQRLARCGLVRSERGPKGGFMLARNPSEINLLEIYESIEGPLADTKCLKKEKICISNRCIFGDLLCEMNSQLRKYLTETKLTDLAGIIGDNRENLSKSCEN